MACEHEGPPVPGGEQHVTAESFYQVLFLKKTFGKKVQQQYAASTFFFGWGVH